MQYRKAKDKYITLCYIYTTRLSFCQDMSKINFLFYVLFPDETKYFCIHPFSFVQHIHPLIKRILLFYPIFPSPFVYFKKILFAVQIASYFGN